MKGKSDRPSGRYAVQQDETDGEKEAEDRAVDGGAQDHADALDAQRDFRPGLFLRLGVAGRNRSGPLFFQGNGPLHYRHLEQIVEAAGQQPRNDTY